ncbi:MAG: response regulator [bacterium]|nr:response regulator [bacterium]
MKRILLAEDEAALRLLYERTFQKAGYEIKAVGTAQEAVAEATSSHFDCIVLDIRMPGMDGIEGMQRILASGKRCPIVLNTAYTSYKDNFHTWSADAYIVKSSDTSPLVDTVNRLTGDS